MPAVHRPRTAPWTAVAAGVLLALLFALEAASVRDKDLTYDASYHLRYGRQVLHGDATRFDDSKMPVSAWNALPGRLAEAAGPGRLGDSLAADATARYPTMLASLALAGLVFLWSRDLYGPAAALLSLFLHAFDPNLLAHSRLVTTDLYAALTTTLSLYTFWRFSNSEGRASRWAWGGAAALALGLAQVAKYSGAYLAPLLLLVAVLRHAPEALAELRRRSYRRLAGRLGALAGWTAVFALALLLVIHVAFLFQDSFWRLADYRFRSEPFQRLQAEAGEVLPGLRVPVPYPYLEGLDWVLARERTGVGYGNVYLLGETRSGAGFPGYFLVACLYKVPLPIQIAWLAAAAAYLSRWRRFRFLRDEALLLVPAAFFFVYLNFFFRAQMGIRYFLPVFPLLHVFAGCLLAPPVWQGLRRRSRAALGAVSALLGVWLVASVLSYYPHFLPYMNELLPDRKMAYRILADSNLDWGQDAGFVARYLREHPEVVWQPAEPTAGRILVGTNWLTGVFRRRHDTWLHEHFDPVAHLRYSHLLFEVTEEDLARLGLAGTGRRDRGAPPPEPRRNRRRSSPPAGEAAGTSAPGGRSG